MDVKAVVVLSGGQDSATCLALAVRKYGAANVAAITFHYGQRHALETKFAKRLARRFGVVAHKVVALDFYRHLTTNALMSKMIPIEWKKGAHCPTTVVEGRNAFFLLAQQKMLRLALEWPVKIVTPFMHMSKADEWALADRLGILDVIENETLTCYNGIPGKGCGKCPACRLRNHGYAEFRRRCR